MKKRRQPTDRHDSSPPDDEDRDLFLEALEGLDEIPDKDGPTARPGRSRRVEKKAPDKRLTTPPAMVLDLHGKTAAEARRTLTRAVQRARHEGERTVLVITGKGFRSPGGIAVLKEALEGWVRKDGAAYLEAYSEAPRSLGGRGAYLLYLRP